MSFNIDKFIEYGIVGVFVGSILVLAVISVIRPDTEMIRMYPWQFALETFIIGIVPALTLAIFVYTRQTKVKDIFKWIALLSAKFVALHILLQTSGFYKYFFGK